MNRIDDAIQSVREGTSLYWAFYDPGQMFVEVRFDAEADSSPTFIAPPGWQIDRIEQNGVMYVRRYQPIGRAAIELMLEEMLQHAGTYRYRFHSWLHGDGLV
ncbi:hypothetical protein FPZ54_14680 [Sphingomonas suaedae]|uniref:Uncharacterized protein n=1 Tax=Sphingomonas suaedae TaxID=2599297 RepID=A0A518RI48_9SPHN|nr:hypothetical protein [Sphingomonas suaedae]QDX27125.1 hypothetical protein FPZ54_14680 [Sphingomonas suaedae]